MANQKKQTIESKESKQQQAQAMVDDLMQKSLDAFEKLRYYSQEQVDKICQAMALAAEEHHMDLAVDAAKETGRGLPKIRRSRISTPVNTSGTTSVTTRRSGSLKTTMKTKPSPSRTRWV